MGKISKKLYAISDYVVIFIGLLVYSFGWTAFILSHDITSGGLAGIATLIGRTLDIAVAWPYNIINGILIVIALVVLGWQFSLKTLFSVVALFFIIPPFESFFQAPLLADQPFMAVVIGSILCGIGLGIVFTVNGSTGGTDIIAAIINKYKPMSIGTGLMIIDVFIIGASYFVFRNPDLLVFSVVEVMLVNFTLDFVLNGYRQSMQFFIFSEKTKEISEAIMEETGRGGTYLYGEGAYSGNEARVLMVVARRSESSTIFRIVKERDQKAFITQSLVKGVYGEGFDPIKTSSKKKKMA